MNEIVSWAALGELIEPDYPKPGNGRPPAGLRRMPIMYFVQHWLKLLRTTCPCCLLVQC